MAERREINASTENLNLRDAVALNHASLLKAAFEQRLEQVGGATVTLDAVVEIALTAGYQGTVDLAGRILTSMKLEGGFIVEPMPSGRLTVRR